jgi:murein DD-endopeptidase MepM/ murein hydrolase activator NlpD
MRVLFCFLFIFLGSFCLIWAQETPKFSNTPIIKGQAFKKDTLVQRDTIKPSQIHFSIPEVTENLDEKIDEEAAADNGFLARMKKKPSVVTRDTLAKSLGDLHLVKVSEQLKIDCVWVKSAEYYAIWDSKNINPYRKDASIFKDTVNINLYNKPQGELWASPLERTLQTSSFGYRWGRFHHGVDLDLKMGTPVYTAFDGIVRISAFGNNGYGNYVVIRHKNGLETLYGHLSVRKVEVGQEIKAGQLIGLGGSTGWSTGPHLHFEVRYEGNTLNPLLIYDFSKTEVLFTDKLKIMPHHFAHLGNKVRQTIVHQVVQGENLSIISAKYNVPVAMIIQLNHLDARAELKVGQSLRIR